jgi:UDP-2,3-diacylglucosamine hydrolase
MRVRFVSDLHLDAKTPASADACLKLLCEIGRDAADGPQVLYILGDLFETWIGDDDPDPFRDEICRALKATHAEGVQLYVMAGNRDFLFGDRFTARTGAKVLPDPTVATLFGERVLLTHGDLLCTDDIAYQQLRSTVRDPSFQQRLLQLPLEARQQLASSARAGSRAHTATTAADIMDVNEMAVTAAFTATGTHVMVHGHTHRPGEHRHTLADGQEAIRYVLDAWHTEGGVLELTHDGWHRHRVPFTP